MITSVVALALAFAKVVSYALRGMLQIEASLTDDYGGAIYVLKYRQLGPML